MAQVLELPYQNIGKGKGRTIIRDTNKVTGAKLLRETYMIPFDLIFIREGFNARTEYDPETVATLAASLEATGLNTPLTVDLVTDEGNEPKYYVELGHYRWQGLNLLRQLGKLKDIDQPGLRNGYVECFINPASVDEETRIIRLVSSNQHTPLKPLEMANVCHRLKTYFGRTSAEIAAQLGQSQKISRQTVDNYLVLAEQPDHIKESFKKGDLTLTEIMQMVRDRRKADKEAQKKEENSHKTSAKGTYQENADKVDMPDTLDDLPANQQEDEDEDRSPLTGLTDKEARVRKEEPEPEPTTFDGPATIDQSDPDALQKDEYKKCQRVVANLDKLDVMIAKLPDQQLASDLHRLIRFIYQDMEDITPYVLKCKK